MSTEAKKNEEFHYQFLEQVSIINKIKCQSKIQVIEIMYIVIHILLGYTYITGTDPSKLLKSLLWVIKTLHEKKSHDMNDI